MSALSHLFDNNRKWADGIKADNPDFFESSATGQSPRYLWIGCADSRVPASQVVGLGPGELFVHRNVANMVIETDLNCLTVMRYAIDVLKVRDVLVVGHYGCGGVQAAYENTGNRELDHWLCHIREVQKRHHDELEAIADKGARLQRLCELNVITQVGNVCRTKIVQQAWQGGQSLAVHGLVYNLADGLLKNLNCTAEGATLVSRDLRE